MTAGRKHREPWRARKDDNHDVNYRQVIDQLSLQSRQVIGLAQADLRELMSYVDELTPEAGRNLLIDALPQLVSSYGDIASAQALEWYADLREAERVPTSFTPRAASGVEAEKVVAETRRLAGGLWEGQTVEVTRRLADRLNLWVHYASRETIVLNSQLDPTQARFARVPRGPKTCAFCEMLASRGFVYASSNTAGEINKFHSHCDCEIVPSWKGRTAFIHGYDPDAMYDRYRAARELVIESGGDRNDEYLITEKMRRLFPEKYKDGVGAGGRSSGIGRAWRADV